MPWIEERPGLEAKARVSRRDTWGDTPGGRRGRTLVSLVGRMMGNRMVNI